MDNLDPDNDVPRRRRRGFYLLPNLFTTGTLFAGFYAIIAAIEQHYVAASVAIFLGMLCDALDGRVARLTNTQSDFGKEYDSLADMVAFGLTPALVMYNWSLHSLAEYGSFGNQLGWATAFFYAAMAALRLARFNVHKLDEGDRGYFFGLPSPAAAALTMGFVWCAADFEISGSTLVALSLLLTVGAGALMVSTVRYPNFKQVKLSEHVPFTYILLMVLAFLLIRLDPPRVLFLVSLVYALTGPVMWLRRRARRPAAG